MSADAINRGIATEAAGALTRAGFEILGLARMEIHCDVRNVRSAAVPRKLGYTHDATLRGAPSRSASQADSMIWTMFADEYPTSAAARAEIEAFDILGRTDRCRERAAMMILANSAGGPGMGAATAALQAGLSALDAIEAGIRPVESDPAVRSVGVGGWPNLLGQVELDASIMDGRTLRTGAVGALRASCTRSLWPAR